MRLETSHILTIQINITYIGYNISGNQIEKSGFPGTVWTNQPGNTSPLYLHIYTINRNNSAKVLTYILYLNHELSGNCIIKIAKTTMLQIKFGIVKLNQI